jgi:hypothetical protein
MRDRWLWTLALVVVEAGCGVAGPVDFGEDDAGDGESVSDGAGSGAAGPSGGSGAEGPTSGSGSGSGAGHGTGGDTASGAGGGPTTETGTGGSATGGGGSASTGAGGSGGTGPGGCYTEGWDPTTSLSDLEASYSGGQWLGTMLEVLARRYHNGHHLMAAVQNDPWLTSSFPGYFDLNSWGGMIESIDTACHEETHGYDFDAALNLPGEHLYYMGSNLEVAAPELNGFFARSEILGLAQQGGSVTSNYDSTYLTGTQGSYDFIFLADELTAYINGLACAVGVGDELSQSGYGFSYRDGAASHLYYLQLYLKVARTQHPSLYSQWQADPDWQSFVRLSWARGHYWTQESSVYPKLGINDAAIWQRINDADNLQEIQLFTGDDPTTVACNP